MALRCRLQRGVERARDDGYQGVDARRRCYGPRDFTTSRLHDFTTSRLHDFMTSRHSARVRWLARSDSLRIWVLDRDAEGWDGRGVVSDH